MGGFSLTLIRHRLAAAREQARQPRPAMAPDRRPDGRLLWAHFGRETDPRGAWLVLEEVSRQYPDLHILTTGKGPHPGLSTDAPADTPSSADVFYDAWSPDVALFIGNEMFPTLWSHVLRRGTACLAADINPARQHARLVEPLAQFDAVIARRPDTRLGPVVEALGALSTVPPPPPCDPAALAEMSRMLATRPLWYAHGVPEAELTEVLAAHRRASRLAHRLLLILDAPRDAAASALDEGGWRWRMLEDREDAEPKSDTQVILSDAGIAPGLWLRLAPITFLGGTLVGSGPGLSPYAPATLGSSVLHGPVRGNEDAAFERLKAHSARRLITSGEELGAEVERLLNADLAAEMASAGWLATGEGAEASARLIELLGDTISGLVA